MSISLKNLKSKTAILPSRFLVYGPPGLGKTTLATEFPSPVVLDIERGLPAGAEIPHFEDLNSFDDVMDAIGVLYSEDHEFKTIVLDSLDRLEPMVWAKVCADNNWKSIEDAGYGKGYTAADSCWRDLVDGLNGLRRDRGMAVVLVAHSIVSTFDDPRTASYSRYDIRLHKRAVGIVQDEVDAILFLNQDATVKQNDPKAKSGPGMRAHAEGGGTRWVYCEGRPAWAAKNRFGLPDRFIFKQGQGYAALAPYLPGAEVPAPVKKVA